MKQTTKDEINNMLNASDKIAHEAYSRMLMNQPNHRWAQHTKAEIDFILKQCSLPEKAEIVDFGCGIGRHTIELYNRNFNVIGVDYSNELLSIGRKKVNKDMFICDDCRTINLEKQYDMVLCLYDVVGTFVDNDENIKILQNIHNHLKDEGCAVISIMNMDLTKAIAKHTIDLETEHNKFLELQSSNTMEKSGQIFNPDYFMLDERANIVYRKEHFAVGEHSHQELIVRDYRYTRDQIIAICENIGFSVELARYVQAGKWDVELDAIDNKAKEILLVCRKSQKNKG